MCTKQVKQIEQSTGKCLATLPLQGTSNWSEYYLIYISGMGLIIKQNFTNLQKRQLPIQEQLKTFLSKTGTPNIP